MANFVKNTTLILFFSALLFAFVELVIRQFFPQTSETSYSTGDSLGIKDPVTGHLNRPSTRAVVSGPEFTVEYIVDDRGFRSDSLASKFAGKSGHITVLLLGDSFVFGAANNFDDIWPEVLAKKFSAEGQKVEIINAGVPGFDTSQQALYLEDLFQKYQADIVLLTFLPNDLFANEPIQKIDGLEVARGDAGAVVKAGGGKKSKFQSVTLLKRMLMQSDSAYIRLYLLTPRRDYFSTLPSDAVKSKVETTRELLLRIQHISSRNGADLAVLSIPQLYQVLHLASGAVVPNIDPRRTDAVLGKFASETGIKWIPSLEALAENYAETKDELYFRYDGHLTAAGNQVIAEIAYDALKPMISPR